MMKFLSAVALAVSLAGLTLAQAPQTPLEFEVASVRPAAPAGQQQVNVGLRLDGSQARIASYSIGEYIAMAYRVRPPQVSGPDWIANDRYDINAKLPEGATSSQIPEMLQSLLASRFGLKIHHEKRDLPVYALVTGKGPLKLKEAPADASSGEAPKGVVNLAASGSVNGVSINLGNGSGFSFANDRFEATKVSMETFARVLERYMDRPVLNLTELKGNYDLSLNLTPEDYRIMLIRAGMNSGVVLPPQVLRLVEGNSPESLFEALQQVGLKLDARKSPLDVIVIDQVNKASTDN